MSLSTFDLIEMRRNAEKLQPPSNLYDTEYRRFKKLFEDFYKLLNELDKVK